METKVLTVINNVSTFMKLKGEQEKWYLKLIIMFVL